MMEKSLGKTLLLRLLLGFMCAVSVCLIVQLAIALAAGNVVTPAFRARFRSESAAALTQLLLAGVIGAAFSGASLIFEIERWGFLKQGIVHFLLTAAVWAPIACVCWMPVSRAGVLTAIGGWTLTYAVIWLVQYFLWKRRVREVNRKIREARGRDEGH